MTTRKHLAAYCVFQCLLIGFIGCGVKNQLHLVAVTGTVTIDDEPLPDAVVIFSPEKSTSRHEIASGKTNQDGVFSLQTERRTGAVVATHGVTVFAPTDSHGEESELERIENRPQAGKPVLPLKPTSRIPMKYAIPGQSGLSYPVEEGRNDFDIELTSKPSK
jgi:hypothetical protein